MLDGARGHTGSIRDGTDRAESADESGYLGGSVPAPSFGPMAAHLVSPLLMLA
jgi:hypothetical protein